MPEVTTDHERLIELVSSIPAEDRRAIFGTKRFLDLHRLCGGNDEDLSDSLVPKYVVALEGSRVLANRAALSAMLQALPSEILANLSKRYLEKPFERAGDNALALASRPLTTSSEFGGALLGALGLNGDVVSDDKRLAVEEVDPIEPLPPLLDFQTDVKRQCAALIELGERRFLIHMPTGSGKTRTALEVLVDLILGKGLLASGRSVVWLAHTEELCEQAVDAFASVWAMRGNHRARIARLWGNYSQDRSSLTGAFVVAGTARLHSMSKRHTELFGVLSRTAAAVVLDEGHRATAPTLLKLLRSFDEEARPLIIGLSATPGRSLGADAENKALASVFNRKIVTPSLGDDPIGELRRRGILSAVTRVLLAYGEPKSIDAAAEDRSTEEEPDFSEGHLAQLATNRARNEAILRTTIEQCRGGRQVIAFCCSVGHASLLAAALRLRGIRAEGIDCSMARGPRRRAIVGFAEGRCDVLLNYGVLSTGFDAPKVSTVIIARPTKSAVLYSQMVGRGLRGPAMGGTETCTIIDVPDHLDRYGDLSRLHNEFAPYWTNTVT